MVSDRKLLVLAQKELKKCELKPNVVIDMKHWFTVMKDGTIYACLAGCYLLSRYEPQKPGCYEPWNFPAIEDELDRLDEFQLLIGEYDGPNGKFHQKLEAAIREREMIIERVAHITDKLTKIEKATLAAELINDLEDPSAENLSKFFDELNDTEHGELISRAAERDER